MVSGGSRAGRAFFCPSKFSPVCSAAFLESLQKAYDAGKLQFFAALESFREKNAFYQLLARVKAHKWVVYAKRPFAGPEQVLDYGAAIRTAWPSPTTVCSISKTIKSAFSGRTIVTAVNPRR